MKHMQRVFCLIEALLPVVAAAEPAWIVDESDLDDVRVAPLLQSKWDQESVDWISTLATYNYYTPNNWPCGCDATALAQLMRFHAYPAGSVQQRTFKCYEDYDEDYYPLNEVNLTMKGGEYAWDLMPLVPNTSITPQEREAIGKICYDAGVALRMWYTFDMSTAYPFWHDPLRNVFGFSSAQSYTFPNNEYASLSDSEIRAGILANLDAGYPVLLRLNTAWGEVDAHTAIADGYGYCNGTLYCHLNMGWSGVYDYWYRLPDFTAEGYDGIEYTAINTLAYNIFPNRTGELVTGRVVDTHGRPVGGVTINATMTYGATTVTTNVLTNLKGIYSIFTPGTGSCYVSLSATYQGETTADITTRTKASASPTSVNFITGQCTMPSAGLIIGNSWGNDFVIEVKPFHGIIFR